MRSGYRSGISEEDLPYIFERFYKVDRSRARESRGSGLGLAISRAIVETHGGGIWAESTVGKGSTFKVMLPIAVFVADRLDDVGLCNVDYELLPDPETAE
ncbi:MAG: sensor histidine kinase [Bacilli bacterium]